METVKKWKKSSVSDKSMTGHRRFCTVCGPEHVQKYTGCHPPSLFEPVKVLYCIYSPEPLFKCQEFPVSRISGLVHRQEILHWVQPMSLYSPRACTVELMRLYCSAYKLVQPTSLYSTYSSYVFTAYCIVYNDLSTPLKPEYSSWAWVQLLSLSTALEHPQLLNM
jgi:hypothetical protein